MSATAQSKLSEALLEKCRERAPMYDRENRFCQEDLDELKAAGYLRMGIPRELGGFGMTLAEVGRETRRLAEYAPATALCVNMHNYWVGVAADVWRSGDKSLEWILKEAAAGEVFAAGHAESGNETSVLEVSRPSGHDWVRTPSIQVIPKHRKSSTRLFRATLQASPSRRPGT